MILYDQRTCGGFGLIFQAYGSAYGLVAPSAIISTSVVFGIKALQHWDYFDFRTVLDHPFVFQIFAYILGLILVFRCDLAYQRFWECRTCLELIRSRWVDACIMVVCCDNVSKKSEIDRKTYRAKVVSLFSMLHGIALAELTDFNKPMEILEGVDQKEAAEKMNQDACTDRCFLCLTWIHRTIADRLAEGGIASPTPIVSRLFQDLSHGYLGYENALKIHQTPFPFPYAQLLAFALIFMNITLPFVMSIFIEDVWVCAFLTVCVQFGYQSINEVSKLLEDPFGFEPNDLPLMYYQSEFNHRVRPLLHLDEDKFRAPSLEVDDSVLTYSWKTSLDDSGIHPLHNGFEGREAQTWGDPKFERVLEPTEATEPTIFESMGIEPMGFQAEEGDGDSGAVSTLFEDLGIERMGMPDPAEKRRAKPTTVFSDLGIEQMGLEPAEPPSPEENMAGDKEDEEDEEDDEFLVHFVSNVVQTRHMTDDTQEDFLGRLSLSAEWRLEWETKYRSLFDAAEAVEAVEEAAASMRDDASCIDGAPWMSARNEGRERRTSCLENARRMSVRSGDSPFGRSLTEPSEITQMTRRVSRRRSDATAGDSLGFERRSSRRRSDVLSQVSAEGNQILKDRRTQLLRERRDSTDPAAMLPGGDEVTKDAANKTVDLVALNADASLNVNTDKERRKSALIEEMVQRRSTRLVKLN